jgi:hypothetical protein
MTGLDQNMMQKNLSCRSLGAAKKNIYAFTSVMVLVNLFFVSLGVLLFQYAAAKASRFPTRPTRCSHARAQSSRYVCGDCLRGRPDRGHVLQRRLGIDHAHHFVLPRYSRAWTIAST